MIRLAFAASLLLLATPLAQAASFDCAKAGTPFEKAICASDELSQQDELLAQAYATALGGLSTDAAAEVKAGQKEWLGYAQRICSDDAEPIKGTYTEEQAQCLASTFRGRIRNLEASRMQEGFRFYPIDRYHTEPDTELEPGDFGHKPADKQYHIVKIDRADDVAAAFNEAVDGVIAGQGAFFEPGTTKIASGESSSDYDISTEISDIGNYRISLTTNEYWYGHGAAHGNYFITHRHFLTGEKRMLEASDIFAGDGWQEKLGELAIKKLTDMMGDDLFDGFEQDVPKFAADPLRWFFSDAGLGIQFNIYEVTAYAAGAPTITIPWDELEGLLAENAQQIAYY